MLDRSSSVTPGGPVRVMGPRRRRGVLPGAVFLDRDGVINENRDDYVRSPSQIEILPGALDAVTRLTRAGTTVVIVTNQSMVGRGLVSIEAALSLHQVILDALDEAGATVAASYLCPHAPWSGCRCRKPLPGMLVQASVDLGVDLGRSWMIGDGRGDVRAALSVGARPMLVATGRGKAEAAALSLQERSACTRVRDLAAGAQEVIETIVGHSNGP